MGRTFGLEMEFASRKSFSEIYHAMTTKGLLLRNAGGYGHSDGARWELKSDSSAGGNSDHGNGYEIASRKLIGQDGLVEADWYVTAMNNLREEQGWKVNKFCGVHVHFDLSDFEYDDFTELLRLVMYHEKVILGLNPPSRKGNIYCRQIQGCDIYEKLAGMMGEKSPDEIRNLLRLTNTSGSRYYGLNISRFLTHKRIEFRYSAASLNPKKVLGWIVFLMGIVEKAKSTQRSRIDPKDSVKTLAARKEEAKGYISNLRALGITHKLNGARDSIDERFAKFSTQQAELVPTYGG